MNVRISQELLSEVRSQINRMRIADCKLNLGESEIEKVTGIDSASKQLSDIVWGEHIELKDKMPTDWLRDMAKEYMPHIYVTIKADNPSNSFKFKLPIKGKNPCYFPPKKSSGSDFEIDPSKVTGELAIIVDKHRQYVALNEKWQKIQNDVITYLKSAKSLNSALKNWTDLKAFIPGEYLDRVAAKPERTAERKKAEEMLASIDRNLAVTNATLIKLATT
jgi:hypothetical protein